MSNIQLFQDAFAVNFPVEIADQVLGHMQMLYGKQFDDKYGFIEAHELQHAVCTVLNGLRPAALSQGIQRMNSEKWCPSLPEFRSWCVHDSDWWTADMAWAKALNFDADKTKPITTLAKSALDEIGNILKVEGQKAAHYAFRDIYNDYLEKAKSVGRVQEMWIKPKADPKSLEFKNHERNRKGSPLPPELAAQAQLIYRRAGELS